MSSYQYFIWEYARRIFQFEQIALFKLW
jgi:hypothetical protein